MLSFRTQNCLKTDLKNLTNSSCLKSNGHQVRWIGIYCWYIAKTVQYCLQWAGSPIEEVAPYWQYNCLTNATYMVHCPKFCWWKSRQSDVAPQSYDVWTKISPISTTVQYTQKDMQFTVFIFVFVQLFLFHMDPLWAYNLQPWLCHTLWQNRRSGRWNISVFESWNIHRFELSGGMLQLSTTGTRSLILINNDVCVWYIDDKFGLQLNNATIRPH